MTEPIIPAIPADHAAHDATWMAALAARDPDLTPSERSRAMTALDSCAACADLYADLVAVTAAIPSAAIPARPRDFTLTPADVARLRPRGLRRWVAAIGTARDGITLPLAMGLTTIGIAGLLVATLPALSGSGGATTQVLSTVGAPIPEPAAGSGGAAPAAAPSAEADAMSAAPTSERTSEEGAFTGDDGEPETAGGQGQDGTLMSEQAISDDRGGLFALAIVAGALLIVGLGLFALRWRARRLGDG